MKIKTTFSAVIFVTYAAFAEVPDRGLTATPIIADIETNQTRFLPDGNRLNQKITPRFYRDEKGRTRLDQGDRSTINDSVSGVVYILDMKRRSAIVINAPAKTRVKQPLSNGNIVSVSRGDLGSKNVDGYDVAGREFVSTTPAGSPLGDEKPIEKVTQVWSSDQLKLPLLVTIEDPVAGTLTTRYKNIQNGVSIDQALFKLPPGFQIVQQSQPEKGQFGSFQSR